MSIPALLASGRDRLGMDAVHAVASGTTSVVDVARASLERAREVEDDVHAFRSIDEATVLENAIVLDGQPKLPLKGLVIGVKDVIDTADLPTAYGSHLFQTHQPQKDAESVAMLRELGALVLGKTTSTEFAMFEPTITRNPADPRRTPGGSSSGSAAAVASGIVPIALGTQTAGSVVRPAAYCGIYGFKPSRGWISTEGIFKLSESLDTLGLFARQVADLRLIYEALTNLEGTTVHNERHEIPAVVLLSATEWGQVQPDVLQGMLHLGERLRRRGFAVSEIAMIDEWRTLPRHHEVVMAVEVARSLRQVLGDRVEKISASSRQIVERGEAISERDYRASFQAAIRAREQLIELGKKVDILLTPSALGAAPVGLKYTGDPVMCRPWTLLGVPVANVPVLETKEGIPLGVQAVSPVCDDLGFLESLSSLERALVSIT